MLGVRLEEALRTRPQFVHLAARNEPAVLADDAFKSLHQDCIARVETRCDVIHR